MTKITRRDDQTYSVELPNGRADFCMALTGNVLRSREQRGSIRPGGLLTVTLGVVSLPRVLALTVGDEVSL